jgi:phosphohistidine phosphatase
MKKLLIMRHAKSSWSDAHLSDHDRPLNKRGKRDAPLMGRHLLNEDLVPDLIISSSAKRALATAERVAMSCEYEGGIEVTRDFYHADSDTYLERLRNVADSGQSVLIIGHNPGMEELLVELVGVWERMPTAAIALVEFSIEHWNQLDNNITGELINFWKPKDFPKSV